MDFRLGYHKLIFAGTQQSLMDDYFHTIPAHVQGHLDFDAIPHFSDSRPNLVSLGSDDLIIWRNTKTGESGTK